MFQLTAPLMSDAYKTYQPVFRDGKLLVETSLKEIRALLVSQL